MADRWYLVMEVDGHFTDTHECCHTLAEAKQLAEQWESKFVF
jgi:hypothetical protein